MKTVRYALEALGLYFIYAIFSLLPPSMASGFGGWIGRRLGPRLATSRKAQRHIDQALPGMSETQRKDALISMWDNLGRVMGEYPHLKAISRDHTVIEGASIVQDLIMQEQPAVFFGAHLANWEVNCSAMYTQFSQEIDLTYRAPNNPWSDRLLLRARTLGGRLRAYPKSRNTAKALVSAIKEGRYIGVLLDQKYNEGLPIPFFGQEAMTNPAFVQLCQKYNCPLVPVQNIRLGEARFKLKIHEPVRLFDDGGQARDVQDVLVDINAMMERWIIENPGQWLWLHRRWNS